MGVAAPRMVDGITATEILPIAIGTVPLHLHHGSWENVTAYPKSTDSVETALTGGEEPPPDVCPKGIFNCMAVFWNDTEKPPLSIDNEAIIT